MSQPGQPIVVGATVQEIDTDPPGLSDLSPAAAAGFKLAKIVLEYMAVAMVLMLIIIAVVELINSNHEYAMQDTIAQQTARTATLPDVARLEAWRTGLQGLAATPPVAPTAEQLAAWRDLYDLLRINVAVSQSQAQTLSACAQPLAAKLASTQLSSCEDLIALLEVEARGAAADLDKIRLLTEFSKEVASSHQNTRTFWLQITQLILLNLLLPILTALLGYIFGTHQAPADNSDKS